MPLSMGNKVAGMTQNMLYLSIGAGSRALRQLCHYMPLAPITVSIVGAVWWALLGPIEAWWLTLVGAGLLVVWAFCFRRRGGRLATLCIMVALWHGHHVRCAVLPETLLNRPLLIEGQVIAQREGSDYQHVTVSVDNCQPLNALPEPCSQLQRIQIAVPIAVPLKMGERWSLAVRLIPPHGMANPGLWDTVWRVRRQNIGGMGTLLAHPAPRKLSSAGWQPAQWLRKRVIEAHCSAMATRWLLAMIVGDGSAFDDADWQLFNNTGTTHLVVVSGSHITLAVSFWAAIGRWVVRKLRPTRYRCATLPRCSAALAGVGYTVLAQGGAPAARACVALLPWVVAFKMQWRPSRWQMWWLALASVMLVMPWSLLMPGVWLSFGAVAALYLMHPNGEQLPTLGRLLYCHAMITLLMEGALLFIVGRWAPLAMVANLIAIPWISIVLMPLGMAGALIAWPFLTLAQGCWWLFDLLLTPLIALLTSMSRLCPSQLVDPRRATCVGIAVMIVAVAGMWPSCTRRWRVMVICGAALLAVGQDPEAQPDEGFFDMTVMDVGQGQLVELRTHQHRYLFDTGPQSRAGRRAIDDVWPAPQVFDGVIVSHGDLDHSGGIPSLRQQHTVAQWWAPWALPALSSTTTASPLPFTTCRAGHEWHVDGIRFRFLWPRADVPMPQAENDRSCVLLVEGTKGRALLTGDASAAVEQGLLSVFDQPISVWVAGHHGSHSSNSRALLVRTRPEVMIYSAGYANRYHHPAVETVERVRNVGAAQWNTAEAGAVTVQFLPSGDVRLSAPRHYQTVVSRRL